MGSSHSRVQADTPNLLLINLPQEKTWPQPSLALEPTVSAHSPLHHNFLTAAGSGHYSLP